MQMLTGAVIVSVPLHDRRCGFALRVREVYPAFELDTEILTRVIHEATEHLGIEVGHDRLAYRSIRRARSQLRCWRWKTASRTAHVPIEGMSSAPRRNSACRSAALALVATSTALNHSRASYRATCPSGYGSGHHQVRRLHASPVGASGAIAYSSWCVRSYMPSGGQPW